MFAATTRRPWALRRGTSITLALALPVLALVWSASRTCAARRYWDSLERAECDFNAGRFTLAQQQLAALAARWPSDPEVQFRLGVCAQTRGRRDEALAAWARVPAHSAFASRAAALRGYVLTSAGRYAPAEAVLEDARRDDPASYELIRTLLRLYRFEGRFDEVRRLLYESWDRSPDPAGTLKELWALDNTSLPMEAWRWALENAHEGDDRVWLGRANLATLSGRFEEAARWFDACRERRPNDSPVWQGRLRLARERGDVEGAWQAWSRLPAGSSSEVEVLELHAWTAARAGDAETERTDLSILVERAPGHLKAWERLAALATEAGRADEAERLHRRKATLDRAKDRYRKIVLYESDLASRAGEVARLAEAMEMRFEARAWALIGSRGNAARGSIGHAPAPEDQPGPSRGLPVAPQAAGRRGPPTARLAATRPVFADDAERAGLRFTYDNGQTPRREIPETMAGGVALLDYDGDGWLDVYAVQGGPFDLDTPRTDTDHLFRNNRDGTFRDVTAQAGLADLPRGYTLGVAMGDYDNDGHPDLFLSRLRAYALFRNRGDGTFEDATAPSGLAGVRDNPSSAAFADLDNDGDLDLYVCHYMKYDPAHPRLCPDGKGGNMYCDPTKLDPAPDHVFRNDGGSFLDVTTAAGFTDPEGRGLGVVAADLDDDNRIDLFVANDGTANYVFHNLGGFRFEEKGHASGAAASAEGGYKAGMGVACGDLDGDGLPDLVVTNFYGEGAALYRNMGRGLFTDQAVESGLGTATRYLLGFGTSFLDYDNDGRLDLLMVNGNVNDNRPYTPLAMPVQLLAGDGKGRLTDVSTRSGAPWDVLRIGRGLAVGDLDNDGREDAVVVEQNKPVAYFHNRTPGGHFLTLRLEGSASNRDGVGARVSVLAGGRRQVAQRFGGGSYQSASDPRLHFGLGPATRAESVEVRWPSGRIDRYEGLEADRGYRLRESAAEAAPLAEYGGRPQR